MSAKKSVHLGKTSQIQESMELLSQSRKHLRNTVSEEIKEIKNWHLDQALEITSSRITQMQDQSTLWELGLDMTESLWPLIRVPVTIILIKPIYRSHIAWSEDQKIRLTRDNLVPVTMTMKTTTRR